MSLKTCWCGGPTVWSMDKRKDVCGEVEYHDPFAKGGTPVGEVRKLYIAGPMSGLAQANYPAFNRAAELLEAAGYEVVNPANTELEAAHYVDFLREDLRWMLGCEGVATLDEWEFSTGARNEVQVAGILRMPVRSIGWWLAAQHPERGVADTPGTR